MVYELTHKIKVYEFKSSLKTNILINIRSVYNIFLKKKKLEHKTKKILIQLRFTLAKRICNVTPNSKVMKKNKFTQLYLIYDIDNKKKTTEIK